MKKFYLLLLMLISSSMAWATGIDANPSLNNDGSNDPHMSGVWLLMLDRNNNELWYEMNLSNVYGDYTCIVRLNCYIYGCTYYWGSYLCDYTPIDDDIPSRNYPVDENIIVYDARFCFVIDGVRYGPQENYEVVVYGDALSNPLVETNNYYTMITGVADNVGVAFDNGKAYVYVAVTGYIEGPFYLSYNDNFPDPLFKEGDVNCDNEVNIADVNTIIKMLLSGNTDNIGDVNGDGEINIADVNAIIDILLNGN